MDRYTVGIILCVILMIGCGMIVFTDIEDDWGDWKEGVTIEDKDWTETDSWVVGIMLLIGFILFFISISHAIWFWISIAFISLCFEFMGWRFLTFTHVGIALSIILGMGILGCSKTSN